ncbi:MAG: low molecular weight phosphotyrosine protein phosphatase [Atopobiaceae bacterium]|nr:low molecular weight phosphotyrosine protein phosphatase [Atopobiaceae bacterium]
MASILFVCHGNVCRSTMAQFVFDHLVRGRGVQERFSADSAATSREEIGKDVHRGTRRKLAEMGIACGHHRARQMTRADYDAFDLIIGMDAENLDGMYRILMGESGYGWSWRPVSAAEAAAADPEGKVHLLLDWSKRPRDIADPWYTGDFDETFDDVLEGCASLLDHLLDG